MIHLCVYLGPSTDASKDPVVRDISNAIGDAPVKVRIVRRELEVPTLISVQYVTSTLPA